MRRADRLFEIIQVFRRSRGPLTAAAIASELGTSKRTVYRDIDALIAQRVPIRGEAGVGFVLEGGYDLPTLMFTADEIAAVVLGAEWVAKHADPALARAAAAVMAKVASVVPEGMRGAIQDPVVGTLSNRQVFEDKVVDVAKLRAWSQSGRKLAIRYVDEVGQASDRIVWPFMIGFLADVRVIMAWCELRSDFRVFRSDRLQAIDFLDDRYPERSASLRRRWLATRGPFDVKRHPD